MMDKRKIYKKLMVIGRATGCHQLPERSFSFRGKQFPVCARCTGVFIGEVLGIFLFEVGEISNIIAVVFSLIMFADWFVQYKFHYESNTEINNRSSVRICVRKYHYEIFKIFYVIENIKRECRRNLPCFAKSVEKK